MPEIDRWYVAGHSLGGSMACAYAAAHFEDLEGVILLASYTASDLGTSNLRALSIYGSLDGVLNMDKTLNQSQKMPLRTTYVEIPGGNHAGFGDYGPQAGDNEATIPADVQRAATVEAIRNFLEPD
jgi:pimeloyl-ACP methyl ester carboxylesterase